jgi:hypothetical protein
MAFEKNIKFYPAFDERKSGFGIKSVEMFFYLKGEKGTVQFLLYTGWHLPHVAKELDVSSSLEPLPADLGYHSYAPMYEGQEKVKCNILNGEDCYYDGSSLDAIRIFDILLSEGSDGVWKALEEYYKEVFGSDE